MITKAEKPRGCGYRKEGGIYLVGSGFGVGCGKLPIPLTVCPHCKAGIKPSRGWTWLGWEVIKDAPCSVEGCGGCVPFNGSVETFGLLWIGEQFYPTPADFNSESLAMGISRRIAAIPRGFEAGKTWVLLAHRKGIKNHDVYADITQIENQITALDNEKDEAEILLLTDEKSALEDNLWMPTIFKAFVPSRLEYIVSGEETDEEMEALEDRGLTLVKIEKLPADD